MMSEKTIDLAVEFVRIGKVHQTNGAPPDLVLISRTDAAFRCTDFDASGVGRFAVSVELAMQGENERNILGDLEIVGRDFDALRANFLSFLHEMVRIKNDAVADDRQFAGTHDARRQEREFERLAVNHQSMAGVMPTLETHHDIGGNGKPIDDLAFALVAPLGADNHHIGHTESLDIKNNAPAQQQGAGPGLIAPRSYAIGARE